MEAKKSKVALVTGANQGVGYQVSNIFAPSAANNLASDSPIPPATPVMIATLFPNPAMTLLF
ncbi:hypothetical protein ACN9ML_13920 [Dyadobacter endophyticus]|uniref:hypothetical protein n=1 Tax=Dyadobacter endophyticus TaxID=1749036 RepID=UPI003CEE4230